MRKVIIILFTILTITFVYQFFSKSNDSAIFKQEIRLLQSHIDNTKKLIDEITNN